MAQIRGTAGYHLGNQSPFGNAGRSDETRNDPSPLDQLRAQTNKLEDMLDTVADPIKPLVPLCPLEELGVHCYGGTNLPACAGS